MRALAAVIVLSLMVSSCGESGEGGVDQGTSDAPPTTIEEGDGAATSVLPAGSDSECLPDTICETELRLEMTSVSDDEMEELAIDGTTAFAVTDSGALLVIDLESGNVISTFQFDTEAVDVALDGSDIWILTGDGPAKVDPGTGALSNQGSLQGFGDVGHLSAGQSGIWVVSNGTADVSHFDRDTGVLLSTTSDYDNLNASGRPRIAAAGDSIFVIDEYAGRVLEIDPADDSIARAYADLGFESETDGSTTSILAPGPVSLVAESETIWVLSNLANPEGEFISGVGAVYTLDPTSGSSEKAFDLVGDPDPETSFAVTDSAVWYIETTSGELIRVDRGTGLQHRLRSDGFYTGAGVVASEGTIWVIAGGSLLHIDDAVSAAALSG